MHGAFTSLSRYSSIKMPRHGTDYTGLLNTTSCFARSELTVSNNLGHLVSVRDQTSRRFSPSQMGRRSRQGVSPTDQGRRCRPGRRRGCRTRQNANRPAEFQQGTQDPSRPDLQRRLREGRPQSTVSRLRPTRNWPPLFPYLQRFRRCSWRF
jgi:hypothetical protein